MAAHNKTGTMDRKCIGECSSGSTYQKLCGRVPPVGLNQNSMEAADTGHQSNACSA